MLATFPGLQGDKFDVVARHHLMFNTADAADCRSWVFMSIEKNRNGVDNVDLEIRKRFEHNRSTPTVDGSKRSWSTSGYSASGSRSGHVALTDGH
ncbi:MAG: hypothetical protein ACYDDU_03480 [Dermatophilaceae bacterium]